MLPETKEHPYGSIIITKNNDEFIFSVSISGFITSVDARSIPEGLTEIARLLAIPKEEWLVGESRDLNYLNQMLGMDIQNEPNVFSAESDLLDDDELFELMKQRNNILFAYIGMKVEVDGIKGIILGNQDDDLLVQFNQTPAILSRCPLNEHSIKYYDADDNIVGHND